MPELPIRLASDRRREEPIQAMGDAEARRVRYQNLSRLAATIVTNQVQSRATNLTSPYHPNLYNAGEFLAIRFSVT